jgi:nuclear transport factor 2 (NTF2) superfamily protein
MKQLVTAWLEGYKRAWESRDPDLIVTLFTPDAPYYETPFSEPALGREGIRHYWQEGVVPQREVRFQYHIITVVEQQAFVRWQSRFHLDAEERQLDGIFLLTFAPDGLCSELREWWHEQRKSL